MVSIGNIVLLVFCNLFPLDLKLYLRLVCGQTALFVVLYYYWFSWFVSCWFIVLSFYVLESWELFAKDES